MAGRDWSPPDDETVLQGGACGLKRLPVSDTGKNGRGLLWRLVPEDYPDAFPDRFQVETACRSGGGKRDHGLPAEASAQAGGRLEPFPHDLRPAELYALVGRTA